MLRKRPRNSNVNTETKKEESKIKKSKKKNTDKLHLLEMFISIQGEGHKQGLICTFIRFKHCNLSEKCYICDTQLRMKTTPEAEYNIDDILDTGKYSNYNFVITGGEPTLEKYHDEIISFIEKLYKKCKDNDIIDNHIIFETNGHKIVELIQKIRETKIPKKWIFDRIHVIYSPKNYIIREKDNKKCVEEIENKIDQLLDLGLSKQNICLKMVAFDRQNKFAKTFTIIRKLLENKIVPKTLIYIMPEGVSKEDLLLDNRLIYEFCVQYGVNFSTRIHIMHNMY